MIKNFIYVVLFCISMIFATIYLTIEKDNRVSKLTDQIKKEHQYQIDSAILQYKNSTELIFNSILNNEDILVLQKKALDSKDKKQRDLYRQQLYKKLELLYTHLKKFGIKQLHFHLPDTTSFLRFHKPKKYGDNLKDIRYSLVIANNKLKKVSGFEEGRIFNGYRFVYPLFYKKEHIGSVETSIGFSAINKTSKDTYKTYQYMILNKNVVQDKVFRGEQKNYKYSRISKDFYHEANTFVNYKKEFAKNSNIISFDIFNKINAKFKNSINKDILLKYFSIVKYFEIDGEYYFISFLPIENIKKENIGYIISYSKSDEYGDIINLFNEKMVHVFIIFVILFIFLIRREMSRDRLEVLNDDLSLTVDKKTKELQKYFEIVNQNISISTTDLKGIITYVNEAFCKMSGYTKDELIGYNHNIIRHPDMIDNDFKQMWDVVQSGKKWQGRIKNIRKDKSHYWLELNIDPIFDDKNNIISYTAVGINITNKIKLEDLTKNQELIIQTQTNIANMQRDKALEASKSKSEFLANMSHEIRTPLNAIMGFIELLREDEKDKIKLSRLNIINNSSINLLEIINDILDFSKIESGNLVIDKIDFNPQKEFYLTKKLFKARFEEKNIRFLSSYNKLPSSLNGDILRIKQVINNLLSNAIKFTKKDKDIFLDILYTNEKLTVNVKDEGIGIGDEYQSKIFDAFTQEDNTTTRKYGGTGLGLTISYNLVKAMGGELKLKSKLGVGSDFYFSIPLKLGNKIKDDKIKESIEKFNGHILLVEDNLANQMFMKVILKKIGLSFDIANDGIEAIEAFKTTKYDLVLMDENMPNMGGIEATKEILKYEKTNNLVHIPIISLTANALKGDRERFINAGMDEYLTKPVNKEKLNLVFEQFLNK